MNDISRAIIAIFLMIMPWVCRELGEIASEEILKEKENEINLEILGKFWKEYKGMVNKDE